MLLNCTWILEIRYANKSSRGPILRYYMLMVVKLWKFFHFFSINSLTANLVLDTRTHTSEEEKRESNSRFKKFNDITCQAEDKRTVFMSLPDYKLTFLPTEISIFYNKLIVYLSQVNLHQLRTKKNLKP